MPTKLELYYFDNRDFFDDILAVNNLYITGLHNHQYSIESYQIMIKDYIKNLGYDFEITIGKIWANVFLEGKSSDLTHFKLKYL